MDQRSGDSPELAVVKRSARKISQGVAGGEMFTAIYHEPTDEDWKEAWKITEAVLLKMRDEVAQKGGQFYVVVVSNITRFIRMRRFGMDWPTIRGLRTFSIRTTGWKGSAKATASRSCCWARTSRNMPSSTRFIFTASTPCSGTRWGVATGRMATGWPEKPSPSGSAPG